MSNNLLVPLVPGEVIAYVCKHCKSTHTFKYWSTDNWEQNRYGDECDSCYFSGFVRDSNTHTIEGMMISTTMVKVDNTLSKLLYIRKPRF